ncbi:hypothetical protein Hdeb2414_s0024g00654351 [Helianthus debilis subsp. tardiflorus]
MVWFSCRSPIGGPQSTIPCCPKCSCNNCCLVSSGYRGHFSRTARPLGQGLHPDTCGACAQHGPGQEQGPPLDIAGAPASRSASYRHCENLFQEDHC